MPPISSSLLSIAARPVKRTIFQTLHNPNLFSPRSTALRSLVAMSGYVSLFDQLGSSLRCSLTNLYQSVRFYSSSGDDSPAPESPAKPSWGYEAHNGPATWAKSYPIANGQRQSPIDLRYDLTTYDRKLTDTKMSWKYVAEDSLYAENNGVQLVVKVEADRSSLTGGPLETEYKIENFHFHWGQDNSCGSEHLLEGKAFPAEVHVVHWNTAYGSFSEAADKPDGLCVLGCFIEEGSPHQGMTPLFNHLLNHCKYRSGRLDLSSIGGADPASLLPDAAKSPEFFSYAGSLTTPPLLESVLWINFLEPISFSKEQLEILRSLSQSADEEDPKIVNNFRPVCPLGNRSIARSF